MGKRGLDAVARHRMLVQDSEGLGWVPGPHSNGGSRSSPAWQQA